MHTCLAFPDHRHKLVEIELLIAIDVMRVVLHRIAPHAAFKGLLAGTRLVIAFGRIPAATFRRGSRLALFERAFSAYNRLGAFRTSR